MRVLILAGLTTVVSCLVQMSSAQASSIELITASSSTTPSVMTLTCATCEPLEKAPVAAPQTMTPGTQRIELRTVNGQKQLVRTEALLGGTPVTFVHKQAGWLDNDSQLAGMPTDGVDATTRTSALDNNQFPADDMSLRLK